MSSASLTSRGGFARDREFALFDETGFVNGKREPAVHALRVIYDRPLPAPRSRARTGPIVSSSNSTTIHANSSAARDPQTGLAIAGFAKRVAERRAATLPAWADASRFNHYYRLAVNTRPATPQTGREVRIGDAVSLLAADERALAG